MTAFTFRYGATGEILMPCRSLGRGRVIRHCHLGCPSYLRQLLFSVATQATCAKLLFPSGAMD
jgi:hypothetical protein